MQEQELQRKGRKKMRMMKRMSRLPAKSVVSSFFLFTGHIGFHLLKRFNLGCADHPEWILLCDACDDGWHASCLRPPLMVIPEVGLIELSILNYFICQLLFHR